MFFPRRKNKQHSQQPPVLSAAEKQERFLDAARNNDVAGIKKYFSPREAAFQACLEAITSGAPDALQALLQKNGGFDLSRSSEGDARASQMLIDAAKASEKANDFIPILYKANKGRYGGQPDSKFLFPAASVGLIQRFLEGNSDLFGPVLENIGLHDTQKLKVILTYARSDDEAQQKALNDALIAVSKTGDIDKAALLLASGADADADKAKALQCAAQNGRVEMLGLLFEHTDLISVGDDIATRLEGDHPDMAALISSATAIVKEEAEKEAAEKEAQTAVEKSDMLLEKEPLPDGGTLTTLFNFRTRQQHNILTAPDGTTAGATTVNFKDIDADVIAAAKEKSRLQQCALEV